MTHLPQCWCLNIPHVFEVDARGPRERERLGDQVGQLRDDAVLGGLVSENVKIRRVLQQGVHADIGEHLCAADQKFPACHYIP